MSRSASPNRLCVRELQTVFILASLQMRTSGCQAHRLGGQAGSQGGRGSPVQQVAEEGGVPIQSIGRTGVLEKETAGEGCLSRMGEQARPASNVCLGCCLPQGCRYSTAAGLGQGPDEGRRLPAPSAPHFHCQPPTKEFRVSAFFCSPCICQCCPGEVPPRCRG